MTITFNGTKIQIIQPVHTISVNKNRVTFTDSQGDKAAQFSNVSERRNFIDMLVSA
ncbi:MAG: hypothetical protein ACI86X_001634 [Moritella sp.]|jgi:hypothetical protein